MEAEDPKFNVHLVPHWHHLHCFIQRRDELGAENLGANEIPGNCLDSKYFSNSFRIGCYSLFLLKRPWIYNYVHNMMRFDMFNRGSFQHSLKEF